MIAVFGRVWLAASPPAKPFPPPIYIKHCHSEHSEESIKINRMPIYYIELVFDY